MNEEKSRGMVEELATLDRLAQLALEILQGLASLMESKMPELRSSMETEGADG